MDSEGRTAVHYAAFFGKHRALKFLVEAASDWTPRYQQNNIISAIWRMYVYHTFAFHTGTYMGGHLYIGLVFQEAPNVSQCC